MSHLSLGFLGEPMVSHAGQTVRFPTRKTLALLAYLTLEEGMHARELLTALLWPERGAQQGRSALRNTLLYLRQALEDRSAPHLLIERDTLGFDRRSECMLDVWTLAEVAGGARDLGGTPTAELQAALALYRGDFLAGVALNDAPEWEAWATLQRERCHQRIHSICERLAAEQRAAGDLVGAMVTLQRWIALNPLHEPAYQQLMQLYLAAGDRAAVQRTYMACRARIREAFDAEPAPETRTLAAAARAAPLPLATATVPAAPRQIDTPLVGREHEYLRLIDWYAQLRHTGALVVSLEGEPGVGKTRLVHEFLDWASSQGADVARGRAFEASGRLPYQPLVEAWRTRLEHENAPDDLLADVWLTELSRLLPELRERYPDLLSPAEDEQAAQSRLYEALARLGLALAMRRPLVLFIDDLQWADDASLDALRYMARRWFESRAPVLLLITVRAEALRPGGLIAIWLAAIEREGQMKRLPVQPFSPESTYTLIRRLADLDAVDTPTTDRRVADDMARFAAWLHLESGGLPFFMSELLKSLLERGLLSLQRREHGQNTLVIAPTLLDQPHTGSLLPPGVRDVIRARLFQLDPDAFAMLVAGAILGQTFTFDDLCQVAEVGERAGLTALDDLLGRRLLQPAHGDAAALRDEHYMFAHDKIRDVVYTEAGDARRLRYHRRACATLERSGAPPAELARHALAARQPAAAFHHSVAAGDDAMRLFAMRTAVAHYEQARQLAVEWRHHRPADADANRWEALGDVATMRRLYGQLGRAYELLSAFEQARTTYQTLLALARDSRDATAECVALNRLATLAAQSTYDLELSQSLLQEARGLAEQSGNAAGLAETEWNLAQLGVYRWDPHATLAHGQRALTLARELEQEDLVARSLNVLALGCSDLGQWRQMERHAAAAARIYARQGNQAMEADSLVLLGNALVMSGRTADGIVQGRRALAITRAIGNPWGHVTAILHLCNGLTDAGAYAEALALAQEGAQLARSQQIVPLLPYMLAVLGDVQRALLLLDQACATHCEALAADEAMPTQPFAEMIHSALCADYGVAGDWDRAYRHARQALEHRRETTLYLGLTRWYETEALLQGGDAERARADAVRFVARVEAGEDSMPNPRFQIAAGRCRAVLAEWDGEHLEAIGHLASAFALATTLALPGEQWPIAATMATWYQTSGERAKASDLRQQSATLAAQLTAQIEDAELRARFWAAAANIIQGSA